MKKRFCETNVDEENEIGCVRSNFLIIKKIQIYTKINPEEVDASFVNFSRKKELIFELKKASFYDSL